MEVKYIILFNKDKENNCPYELWVIHQNDPTKDKIIDAFNTFENAVERQQIYIKGRDLIQRVI